MAERRDLYSLISTAANVVVAVAAVIAVTKGDDEKE